MKTEMQGVLWMGLGIVRLAFAAVVTVGIPRTYSSCRLLKLRDLHWHDCATQCWVTVVVVAVQVRIHVWKCR